MAVISFPLPQRRIAQVLRVHGLEDRFQPLAAHLQAVAQTAVQAELDRLAADKAACLEAARWHDLKP